MGKDGPDNSGQNAAAKLQAEIAKEMWEEYKNTYRPLERKYAQEAQDYDTPWRREAAAGRAKADVQQAFDAQRAQADRQMQSYGIAPDSGKFQAMNKRLQIAQAGQQAAGQNAARNQVEAEGWSRRTGALQLGKGMPAGAGQMAGQAGQQFGQMAGRSAANNAGMAQAGMGIAQGGYQFGKDQGWWGRPGGGGGGPAYNPTTPGFESGYGSGGVENYGPNGEWTGKDGGLVRRKKRQGGGIRRGYQMGGYASPTSAMDMVNAASGVPMDNTPTEREQIAGNAMKAYQVGKIAHSAYNAATAAAAPTTAGSSLGGGLATAGAVPAATTGAATGAATTGASAVPGIATTGAALAAPTAVTGAGTGIAAGTAGAAGAGLAGAAGAGAAGAGAAGAGAAGAIGAGLAATGGAAAIPIAAYLAYRIISGKADGGEINAQGGGEIDGPGSETSDSIPAQLSDGEYVLNAESVQHFGIDKLDKMNEVGLKKRYGIRR